MTPHRVPGDLREQSAMEYGPRTTALVPRLGVRAEASSEAIHGLILAR